jgi:hypothetical protein
MKEIMAQFEVLSRNFLKDVRKTTKKASVNVLSFHAECTPIRSMKNVHSTGMFWVSILEVCHFMYILYQLYVAAATSSRWFLVRGYFYLEDGGVIFLRNVGLHNIYMAPYPRRRHSS